jgi:hypothetical protein
MHKAASSSERWLLGCGGAMCDHDSRSKYLNIRSQYVGLNSWARVEITVQRRATDNTSVIQRYKSFRR